MVIVQKRSIPSLRIVPIILTISIVSILLILITLPTLLILPTLPILLTPLIVPTLPIPLILSDSARTKNYTPRPAGSSSGLFFSKTVPYFFLKSYATLFYLPSAWKSVLFSDNTVPSIRRTPTITQTLCHHTPTITQALHHHPPTIYKNNHNYTNIYSIFLHNRIFLQSYLHFSRS